MPKFFWDAGHGGFGVTLGKRTPDGSMYEWDFNSQVVKYAMSELSHYENVTQLRVDDPTGKTDVPLIDRTNRVNDGDLTFIYPYMLMLVVQLGVMLTESKHSFTS